MLTCAQIVTLVCQICKAPGMTTQCGQFLNQTLLSLWQIRDLKMNRQVIPVNVGAGTNGPFALPADYQRNYDLFYEVNGMPFFLNPIDQRQYDALFKDPTIGNYPYFWDTDWSGYTPDAGGVQLYIYPQTNSGIPLTLRYMRTRPDVAAPQSSSTVPWFPNQDYLIKETAQRMMMVTDDTRQDAFIKQAEDILRPYLIMDGDEQQVVKEVRRDPLRFRPFFGLKPSKATD